MKTKTVVGYQAHLPSRLNKTLMPILLGGLLFFVVGCDSGSTVRKLHSEPNIELVQDMMDQPALKAQDEDPYQKGMPGSRLPPEGTVPVGFTPYKYKGDPVAASANLKNPYAGEMTPEVATLGQKKYETYCLVCHGGRGVGDGPVAPKMALKPPSLVSDKIVNMTDGGVYHIITDGQGVMSSYAYQLVDENDRWAIVNYVRSLQKMKTGQ